MLKIYFEKIKSPPKTRLTLYESVNRIPVSMTIGDYSSMPETIYARNFNDGNFIEFRFNKNDQTLFEISLVNIQNTTVKHTRFIDTRVNHSAFYVCIIDHANTKLLNDSPMEILRSDTSICIHWATENLDAIEYFPIASNCFIGINIQSCLASVLLTDLDKESIINILGF